VFSNLIEDQERETEIDTLMENNCSSGVVIKDAKLKSMGK